MYKIEWEKVKRELEIYKRHHAECQHTRARDNNMENSEHMKSNSNNNNNNNVKPSGVETQYSSL